MLIGRDLPEYSAYASHQVYNSLVYPGTVTVSQFI